MKLTTVQKPLTNGDRAVLAYLQSVGLATAGDMVKRFWPQSKQPEKKSRTILRRLQLLEARGLVRPIVQSGDHGTHLVWSLKK